MSIIVKCEMLPGGFVRQDSYHQECYPVPLKNECWDTNDDMVEMCDADTFVSGSVCCVCLRRLRRPTEQERKVVVWYRQPVSRQTYMLTGWKPLLHLMRQTRTETNVHRVDVGHKTIYL